MRTILAAFTASVLMVFLVTAGNAGEPAARQAKGSFEVSLAPLDLHYGNDGKQGRMSIAKTFHGDLDATSQGEMLTATTDEKGSAVYVAIERVEGELHGRKGSFMLHHRGVMHGGNQQLDVRVVPDSGTGELQGISGEMEIRIEDGKHFYEFRYDLK